MTTPSLESILTFLGGVIATIITATASRPLRRAQTRTADREGEASLAHATMEWAKHLEETLSKRISGLKEEYEGRLMEVADRIASLEAENEAYRRHNALLTGQLIDAGIRPADIPDRRVSQAPYDHDDRRGGT